MIARTRKVAAAFFVLALLSVVVGLAVRGRDARPTQTGALYSYCVDARYDLRLPKGFECNVSPSSGNLWFGSVQAPRCFAEFNGPKALPPYLDAREEATFVEGKLKRLDSRIDRKSGRRAHRYSWRQYGPNRLFGDEPETKGGYTTVSGLFMSGGSYCLLRIVEPAHPSDKQKRALLDEALASVRWKGKEDE